jgi:hypothetical protein
MTVEVMMNSGPAIGVAFKTVTVPVVETAVGVPELTV